MLDTIVELWILGEIPQNEKKDEIPKNGKMDEIPKNGKKGEIPKNGKKHEIPKNGKMEENERPIFSAFRFGRERTSLMPYRVPTPLSDTYDLFLKEEGEWSSKSDEERLRWYLVVGGQGDQTAECPLCSLRAPRHLICQIHMAACMESYNRLFRREETKAVPSKRPRIGSLPPSTVPTPVTCAPSGIVTTVAPVVSNAPNNEPPDVATRLRQAFARTGTDPGECICPLRHSAGNKAVGLNFFTSNTQVLRVCEFGHMKNADQLTPIMAILALACEDSDPISEEVRCGGCDVVTAHPLRMTAGKRPNTDHFMEWFFCSEICLATYLTTVRSKSRWDELLREWKRLV